MRNWVSEWREAFQAEGTVSAKAVKREFDELNEKLRG